MCAIHRHKWKGNEVKTFGSERVQKCPCGKIRSKPLTYV